MLSADELVHRYVLGGILAYPPKMYDAIDAWARARYATWAAANALDMIEYHRERIETSDGEKQRDARKSLVEYEQVLRQAKADKARGKPKNLAKKKFKVDFGGLPANYPKAWAATKNITVVAEFTLDRTLGGTWHRDSHTLTIKFNARAPENLSNYGYGIKRMQKTLKHELRHLVQDVMSAYQIDLVEQMLKAQGRSVSDLSPKELARVRKDYAGQPQGVRVQRVRGSA